MAEQDKQQQQPQQPPQHQDRQPGIESKMTPQPVSEDPRHRGSGKLRGKAALISSMFSLGCCSAALLTRMSSRPSSRTV